MCDSFNWIYSVCWAFLDSTVSREFVRTVHSVVRLLDCTVFGELFWTLLCF